MEGTPWLALRGADGWPLVDVQRRVDGDPGPDRPTIDNARAALRMQAGHLSLDRGKGAIVIHSARELEDAEVVHPFLWPAAAVFARWRGYETLHAGAFGPPGADAAWALLGAAGGGKSSLLAMLAAAGYDILVDDLVVIDGDECLAGPRCLDLKPEAVHPLGLGERVTVVRASERCRLTLPPTAARHRLAGFVVLAWGEAVGVAPLAPSESFAVLADHRRVGLLGADHGYLLQLAGLPMLRLTRPRRWSALWESCAALLQALGGS